MLLSKPKQDDLLESVEEHSNASDGHRETAYDALVKSAKSGLVCTFVHTSSILWDYEKSLVCTKVHTSPWGVNNVG